MKKIIEFALLLALATVVVGGTVSAQSTKSDQASPSSICFSSDELLNVACAIVDKTVIGDLSFLGVIPCAFDSGSGPGFYIKDRSSDKWRRIATVFDEADNYFPNGVMMYEDAASYPPVIKYFGDQVGHFKDKYEKGRLVILFYKNDKRGELFEIFDLKTRQILIDQ